MFGADWEALCHAQPTGKKAQKCRLGCVRADPLWRAESLHNGSLSGRARANARSGLAASTSHRPRGGPEIFPPDGRSESARRPLLPRRSPAGHRTVSRPGRLSRKSTEDPALPLELPMIGSASPTTRAEGLAEKARVSPSDGPIVDTRPSATQAGRAPSSLRSKWRPPDPPSSSSAARPWKCWVSYPRY